MIIRPFNAVFSGVLVLAFAAIILMWLMLRQKSEKMRTMTIVIICCFNIIAFFIYKFALSHDTEFLNINHLKHFNWFNELPLQLCNINMFLIPIGLLTKKRFILGFSFFVAPLGAVMALLFPEPAFNGYSLLLPRMMGFYGTHILIFICGVSLATLGLYRPRLSDFPGIIFNVVSLTVTIHCVNLILRATVCPHANYFFTFPVNINILNLFWSWIPIPLLYLLPGMVILLAYMVIVWLVFAIPDEIRSIKSKHIPAQ